MHARARACVCVCVSQYGSPIRQSESKIGRNGFSNKDVVQCVSLGTSNCTTLIGYVMIHPSVQNGSSFVRQDTMEAQFAKLRFSTQTACCPERFVICKPGHYGSPVCQTKVFHTNCDMRLIIIN